MNAARPGASFRRARLLAVCASRLLAWATTVCVISVIPMSVAQETEGQTRFQRTVQYLQAAAPELRGDFAAIALTKLADAYLAEAQLARADARASGRDANLRGWSAMVDYYARQMPVLLEDIELGLPVQLTMGGEQSLAITVADRTVIISPPRLNQQSAFEQGILTEFCARHSCAQFAVGNAQQGGGAYETISLATARVRPDWMFTAQGQVCSFKGLKVRFHNEKNLANSRLICEQFLLEAATLTDALAVQQRDGVLIEWENLDIQATPNSPEHVVRLNALGDAAVVTVPVLYRSPDLLQHVIPWMRQQLNNEGEVNIEVDADRYGWQEH